MFQDGRGERGETIRMDKTDRRIMIVELTGIANPR